MRAIVTGAAGFIGSHVAERLANEGHTVLGIDDLSGGRREDIPLGIDFRRADVQQPLLAEFRRFRPDVVYHLAAYAAEGLSHHIPAFNYANNLVATANVLNASYLAGAEHFVFASSIAVYGHPLDAAPFTEDSPCRPCDPYGIAKLACEQHIRAFSAYHGGPRFTIFRPHNVFGPRQNTADPFRNVVGIFMRRSHAGLPLPIFGDGSQTRSFSYIDTVARCLADAPHVPAAAGATFNVGGDQPLSVLELARRISALFDRPPRIDWLPPRPEVAHAHCDHSLVRRVFSRAYESEVEINEGLRRMAEHVRADSLRQETPCPAPLEIADHLPPSWRKHLSASASATLLSPPAFHASASAASLPLAAASI